MILTLAVEEQHTAVPDSQISEDAKIGRKREEAMIKNRDSIGFLRGFGVKKIYCRTSLTLLL